MRAIGQADGDLQVSGESEQGSAIAEFVMVASLAVLFFAAVLQIAFMFYTQNMLQDAAASGARYGTYMDTSTTEAIARTEELVHRALPAAYPVEVSSTVVDRNGVQSLQVTVSGPLPLLGPFGVPDTLSATGHAIMQG